MHSLGDSIKPTFVSLRRQYLMDLQWKQFEDCSKDFLAFLKGQDLELKLVSSSSFCSFASDV